MSRRGGEIFCIVLCESPIPKPERHSENEKQVCARARNLSRRGCRPARLRASTTTRVFIFAVEKTPARLRHKQRVGLLDYRAARDGEGRPGTRQRRGRVPHFGGRNS